MTAELLEIYPPPEITPAFSEIPVDDGGWMWIRRYDTDRMKGWVLCVFNPRGHPAGGSTGPAVVNDD
jgi:hypothetical protein